MNLKCTQRLGFVLVADRLTGRSAGRHDSINAIAGDG
jgi:hypothetical protein